METDPENNRPPPPAGLLKWVEIETRALRSNLRTALGLLGPDTRLMAVVKADAYGFGARRVSRLALEEGASCLGVFTLDEAADLRRAGIPGPICLLCPPLPAQAREAARLRVEPSVDSLELAEALDREARSPIHVHVDVDYGLGRWGIAPRGLEKFLDAVGRFPRLRLKGVCTHLDYVPGRNAVEAEEKLSDFRRRCSAAKRRRPGLILHAANTSVLLDFPHWGLDMARLGNLIFGVNPTSREIPLEDPWRLCARIVALREVPKGSSIGYASEYLAPRRMRVATLPVGYSDGLTMEPAERLIRLGAGCRYWGMLRGQPAPLVGRCSISHVLADVSLIPGAAPGDPVALPIRRTAAAARLKRIYW